jgi:hypothetical protein
VIRRLRGWRLVLLGLLALYVGSYVVLSRRGEAWCRPLGMSGFLYVLPTDTPDWYKWHAYCVAFYAPANWIDRQFGTGEGPVRGMTLGLSK